MGNSNPGNVVWICFLHFTSPTRKRSLALGLQSLVGQKRYISIWGLKQKIRVTRGERDNLDGFIEIDEGFFESLIKKVDAVLITKPGNKLHRQVKAVVVVSSTPVVTYYHKKRVPCYKSRQSENNSCTILI